jgi:hypothetical protein
LYVLAGIFVELQFEYDRQIRLDERALVPPGHQSRQESAMSDPWTTFLRGSQKDRPSHSLNATRIRSCRSS